MFEPIAPLGRGEKGRSKHGAEIVREKIVKGRLGGQTGLTGRRYMTHLLDFQILHSQNNSRRERIRKI